MTRRHPASFEQYLAAKKAVDDRALNRQVWQRLQAELDRRPSGRRVLRVLELGSGIGTMAERFIEWAAPAEVDYTGVDSDPVLTEAALSRLAGWAACRGAAVERDTTGALHVRDRLGRYRLRFVTDDALRFLEARPAGQRWDLGLAHAFLDLVDAAAVVGGLCRALAPGGLIYLTLNYDGRTTLLPAVDPGLEARVVELYHRDMDRRTAGGRPCGDSLTGRHLFGHLERAGADLLAAGSSDWVVFPRNGAYRTGEAFFLHCIVETIHRALSGHPLLPAGRFERWAAARHAQVEAGRLVYIAGQLDFLARAPQKGGKR